MDELTGNQQPERDVQIDTTGETAAASGQLENEPKKCNYSEVQGPS